MTIRDCFEKVNFYTPWKVLFPYSPEPNQPSKNLRCLCGEWEVIADRKRSLFLLSSFYIHECHQKGNWRYPRVLLGLKFIHTLRYRNSKVVVETLLRLILNGFYTSETWQKVKKLFPPILLVPDFKRDQTCMKWKFESYFLYTRFSYTGKVWRNFDFERKYFLVKLFLCTKFCEWRSFLSWIYTSKVHWSLESWYQQNRRK